MENTAGSSCLNLESSFSSLPTIEELFSTMMENSAVARLSDMITTMLRQSAVNIEGDEADNSSGIYKLSTNYIQILVFITNVLLNVLIQFVINRLCSQWKFPRRGINSSRKQPVRCQTC